MSKINDTIKKPTSNSKTNLLQKIEEIQKWFSEQENHGGNGNNWRHSTKSRFAVDVKLYNYVNLDELRVLMSAKQNAHYEDDDQLYNEIEFLLGFEQESLVEAIKDLGGEEVYFAGRSSGWIEFDYACSADELDESDTFQEVHTLYKKLIEQYNQVVVIKESIQLAHKSYNQYINTTEHLEEIVSCLQSDEELKDHYQSEISNIKANFLD